MFIAAAVPVAKVHRVFRVELIIAFKCLSVLSIMNALERTEIRNAERVRSGAAASERPRYQESDVKTSHAIDRAIFNPNCSRHTKLVSGQESNADGPHGVRPAYVTRDAIKAGVRSVR